MEEFNRLIYVSLGLIICLFFIVLAGTAMQEGLVLISQVSEKNSLDNSSGPSYISQFFGNYGSSILSVIGIIIGVVCIIKIIYRIIKFKEKKRRISFQRKWKHRFLNILELPDNFEGIHNLKRKIEMAIINKNISLLNNLEEEFFNELIALEKCKNLSSTTSLEKRNELTEVVVGNILNKLDAISTKDNKELDMELKILIKESTP